VERGWLPLTGECALLQQRWHGIRTYIADLLMENTVEHLPPSKQAILDRQARKQTPKRQVGRFNAGDQKQIRRLKQEGWSRADLVPHLSPSRIYIAAILNGVVWEEVPMECLDILSVEQVTFRTMEVVDKNSRPPGDRTRAPRSGRRQPALLLGLERNWLRISGVRPHSVSITQDGIDQTRLRPDGGEGHDTDRVYRGLFGNRLNRRCDLASIHAAKRWSPAEGNVQSEHANSGRFDPGSQ
jgi:hypothetical protein